MHLLFILQMHMKPLATRYCEDNNNAYFIMASNIVTMAANAPATYN